jgi:hypothetical protein
MRLLMDLIRRTLACCRTAPRAASTRTSRRTRWTRRTRVDRWHRRPGSILFLQGEQPVLLVEFDHHTGVFVNNPEPEQFHDFASPTPTLGASGRRRSVRRSSTGRTKGYGSALARTSIWSSLPLPHATVRGPVSAGPRSDRQVFSGSGAHTSDELPRHGRAKGGLRVSPSGIWNLQRESSG